MTLKWLCTASNIAPDLEAGWAIMVNLKDVIVQLIDSDNDGVRTHAIKFMEMVVLTQTHRGPTSAPKVMQDKSMHTFPCEKLMLLDMKFS